MAEKTQGAVLRVETARAGAKTITAITAANPPVVSAAAHGYSTGDIVYIGSVVGMTQVNDRAFVVDNTNSPSLAKFALKGVDGTAYTAYSSAGSAFKLTMTPVAEVTSITIGGTGSQQIDITNLGSLSIEQLNGLPNLGSLSFDVTLNHTDTGQSTMRSFATATTPKVITVTTASGYVLCATGYTSNFNASFALNEAQRGTFEFTIYRAPAWFA